MDDEFVALFLMRVAAYIAHLHERSHTQPSKQSNAGPNFNDPTTVSWEHEGFARWMGWRGEEEQEREIQNMRDQKKQKA